MDLELLRETEPWDWPPGTRDRLLAVLRDDRASEADLQLACGLAGDLTVLDDELVRALLAVLHSGHKPEQVRGRAAIGLGPVLELVDTDGIEDPDIPITERTFHKIQESLHTLYRDTGAPKEARRRALEASVRARQSWHPEAVRVAYASDDRAWKLTAVFCMQYIHGFEAQILEALGSEDPEIHYEAVVAAGSWQLGTAWPQVAALVTADETDKPLLLAAIEAAAAIRPDEAAALLQDLADSDDEEIAEAAYDATAMAGILSGVDPLEGDEDDLDDIPS